MGMAVGGPQGGPKSDINMTPMIDVLLVLIIIFMVITPLTPKGLEALVPQPPPPNQPPNTSDQRTVVIVIDRDHKMMINQEPVEEANLQSRLMDIFKTRAERVVDVVDNLRAAGVDNLGLLTEQLQERGASTTMTPAGAGGQ